MRATVPMFAGLTALLLFAACAAGPAELRPGVRESTATEAAFLDLEVKNGGAPAAGLLVSGQPTPEQFAALDQIGVRKVVCLRSAQEEGTGWEEARAEQLALSFVRLPVGKDDIDRDHAERLAIEVLAADGPVLVCCGSGNRVGALFALDAFHARGAEPGEALEVGKRHGLTRLEPVVRQALGMAPLTAADGVR